MQHTHSLDVVCSEERTTIGKLELLVNRRLCLTPAIVWAGFRPATSAYQLTTRPQSTGDYWRCPKCASVLTLSGAKYEERCAPRGREAVFPCVPPSERITREQARAEVAAKVQAHEVVYSSGVEDLPIMLGVTTVVS